MKYFVKLPCTPFGFKSILPEINKFISNMADEIPLNQAKNSFMTLNKFGYSDLDNHIFSANWLLEEIFTNAQQVKHPILEIGGGFGALTRSLLAKNVRVILNDLDERHLLLAIKKTAIELRPKLFVKPGRFPEDLDFPNSSIEMAIFFRVWLFLTPEEIKNGIEKLHRWLIPGSKVYICTMPPQRGEYRDRILPIYEKRWNENNKWPGYSFSSQETFPESVDILPSTIHLMDERPLIPIFESYDFEIQRYGLLSNNRDATSGKELFGLIAQKQT